MISSRLLLIGLDAVPPSLLEECIDAGSMPNLARLRAEGRYGLVTSEADLFPAAVWPTFFTQSDVSHHGIFHLLQWDRAKRSFLPASAAQSPVSPFWRRLASAGAPAITLDVPFSDCGAPAEGAVEVVGWGMHEGVWSVSYPRGLLADLRRRHGRARQEREGPGERGDAEIAPDLPALLGDVQRRAAIIEDLARRFPWRLLLAVFSETHRAGHWFWSERATGRPQGGVRDVLAAVDAVLPRLRALLGPEDHLAVFSLHGMGPTEDADRLGLAAVLHLFPPAAAPHPSRLDPVHLARDLLPGAVVRWAARRMPQPLYNWAYRHLQSTRRDWSRMEWALSPLDHLLYVFANLPPGREPDEAALAAVASLLEAIKTADGRRVISRLTRPAGLYDGPNRQRLPDLIAKPIGERLGPDLVMPDGVPRRVPRPSSRDGEHTAEGFYLQAGPGVPAGSRGPTLDGLHLAAFLTQPAGLSPVQGASG